jgi:molecular chaperone HscA
MALLQISEPGQASDPHQRRIAVGIDLGTTHSLVAAVRHGVAECLPDAQGRVLLPSVVRYLDGQARQVGHDARAHQAEDAANSIASAKRLMGRRLADLRGAEQLPYDLVDQPGMVAVRTRQGPKTAVEISAEILATLRQRAEDTFDADVFGAVITVPAYFDDAQRQATKDAAQWAGLKVLRLINEPTAAAVAYGLDHGSEGLYAVFDLGGGTFDVSLLRLTHGVFEVVATGGDAALGGDDFDHLLADWALRQAGRRATSAQDKANLLLAARRVRETLSDHDRGVMHCPLDDGDLRAELTRVELETLASPLLERMLAVLRRVLRDARVTRDEVLGVVMVGGATRMPMVRRAVAAFLGEQGAARVLTNLNPDEVVALGAAVQAEALSGNAPDGQLLLLDVIPLSLGIETMGGLVERIIERNSTIPVAKAQEFTTYQDGQTAMAIHVVQGERELVADCRSLARFELRGIPPMAAGAARIRVSFQVDADGLLSVAAKETLSGVHANVVVKPSYGLGDEQIAQMLREGFTHAQQDMRQRALREARVEAERMLLATRSALDADGALLSAAQRQQIDRLMAALQELAGGADHGAINAAVESLARGTEEFAAARMNRGIREALSGRSIEDV